MSLTKLTADEIKALDVENLKQLPEDFPADVQSMMDEAIATIEGQGFDYHAFADSFSAIWGPRDGAMVGLGFLLGLHYNKED